MSLFSRARRDLLDPQIPYLVGVSGGRDSIVLLHWLLDIGFSRLIVSHFDHQLRGAESDKDRKFVEETAAELELECIIGLYENFNVGGGSPSDLSEQEARESRYAFFAETAQQENCQRIILAHHANDQAETVLLNLFRGAGLNGLAAMNFVSHREICDIPLEIIRPFLEVPHAEICAYQEDKAITYREDSTNCQAVAVRNRVRHELLPLAEDIFQRDPNPALLRISEISRREVSAAQLRSARWLNAHRDASDRLPVKLLRQFPPAELYHLLHTWLKEQNVPDIGYREVQELAELARSQSRPAKINLPGRLHARRRSGWLFLERANESVVPPTKP